MIIQDDIILKILKNVEDFIEDFFEFQLIFYWIRLKIFCLLNVNGSPLSSQVGSWLVRRPSEQSESLTHLCPPLRFRN